MRPRWLIRALCLTPLLLCLVAWVGSYWFAVTVPFHTTASYSDVQISAGSARGTYFEGVILHDPPTVQLISPDELDAVRAIENASTIHALGFAVVEIAPFYHILVVPFWFPTAISAIFAWYVWRRRGRKGVRAFPVEVANNSVSQNASAK